MARVLHTPDWRSENLPRLRDLVDQRLRPPCATRSRPPRELGERPGQRLAACSAGPAWLASTSFLTPPARDALRLRWQICCDSFAGDGEALSALQTGSPESRRRPRPAQSLKALLHRRRGRALGAL